MSDWGSASKRRDTLAMAVRQAPGDGGDANRPATNARACGSCRLPSSLAE